jgi:hypothetical protein
MVDLLGFQLEKAYDTVMMQQLQYRKKGVTYGSVEVSSVHSQIQDYRCISYGMDMIICL